MRSFVRSLTPSTATVSTPRERPSEHSDDDLFGQTIQSALDYIEYTSVAHSCAKEASQLGHEGAQWSRIMKCGHNLVHTPYKHKQPLQQSYHCTSIPCPSVITPEGTKSLVRCSVAAAEYA